MAEWIAFVLQEAWAQEFVVVIEFLARQFSSALVEGSDITLKHIDEVLGTVMQKHRVEHDFFISDPGLYKIQYPDGIIITLGDVRRPKLWIVDGNGIERGWFITHFREMKQFRERERMNKAFATLEELKAGRLKKPEKPGGAPKSADELDKIWRARTNPAFPDKPSPINAEHHALAKEEYMAACRRRKIKGPAKDACIKECTRVGCDRYHCSEDHSYKTVDPAAIKECPHALLVMSIFGGFKGIPVDYSPDQITTTVQTLFNKLPKKPKQPPARDNDDLVERECRMCKKQFSESQNEWVVEKKNAMPWHCYACRLVNAERSKLARTGKGSGRGQGNGGISGRGRGQGNGGTKPGQPVNSVRSITVQDNHAKGRGQRNLVALSLKMTTCSLPLTHQPLLQNCS